MRGDSWLSLAELGRQALALHECNDWIARRVESIALVDTSQVVRTVTLDVDCGRIRTLFADAGIPIPASVRLPLTLLPKTLLLDLDVRDGSGRALSLLTSAQDSTVAQATMLALLEKRGIKVGRLSQDILDNLFRIAVEEPSGLDRTRLVPGGEPEFWTLLPGSSRDQKVWGTLFQDSAFVDLAATFTLSYAPTVEIPLGAEVVILKYRHLERQIEAASPSWRTRLSLEPYTQLLEIPSIGSCGREHTRFESPEGLFLEYMYPRADPDPESAPSMASAAAGPQPPVPAFGLPAMRGRITPERGVLYTRGQRPRSRPLVIAANLRPRVTGFLRTSQYTVCLSSLLLALGAAAQCYDQRLTEEHASTEAAVALLIVVPTLMSAFLVRDDEHELLSFLLRWPRIIVAASAGIALLAGGALALHVSSWRLAAVWAGASAAGWLVFALLRTIAYLSRREMQACAIVADETFDYD